MIAGRQIFLGRGGGAKLPYDAEVEYLEADGNQWINTLVAPKETQRYVFRANYNSVSRNQALIASYKINSSSPYYLPSFINSGLTGFGVQTGGGSAYATFGTKDTAVHDFDVDFSSGIFQLDETIYTIPTVSVSVNDNPYFLFAANVNGTGVERKTEGKIYYFKIYDNGTLVRDFIPVRFTNELGQSEGAMYDRANPTVGMNRDGTPRDDGLYLNRGTGAFGYGNDK